MLTTTVQQAFELALQHHRAGRLSDAEALYRQILSVQPHHAEALHLHGIIAHQSGQHDLATKRIRQAIALDPNNPAAYSNLGEVCRTVGLLDEAVASCRRALELKEDYPEAYNNLGNALRDKGALDEAIASCRRALELRADYPEAHNNLGNALRDKGALDEAIASCRRALELRADYPEAHNNLGNALADQGGLDEAVAAYGRALELKPDYPEAYVNLSMALSRQNKLDEAVAACRRALRFKTDLPLVHNNLGIVLTDRGEIDEAIAAYRYAIALAPQDARFHSNLIFTLHFHPDQDDRKIHEERFRWNRQFSDPLKRSGRAQTNDRAPVRRLRIGYVSADLRDHVVGRNLLPLFRHHDHTNLEIFCYSGARKPDSLTEEIRQHADRWHSTVGMADETLAETIQRDGVDILVDLTQHFAGNRLPVFARRPAPVQVSFAGYPESTGVEAIEYRISDRWLESESGDRSWEIGWKRAHELPTPNSQLRPAEQVFLIDSFWCYDPCGLEVEVNALPANERGAVTFGCLNNFCKINEPLLKLWARVLRELAEARLVLLSGFGSHRQRTLDFLEREGVAPQRVEFVEPRPRKEYLELYHRLDIVLDPFPYNGHTTSLDALWMGVPVVSLAGKTAVSRAGLSQLSNLGLPELVAHAEDGYLEIATKLARDLPRLAELRRTLRPRMEASVLMDAPRFARNIEAAYRAMWRQWCGKPE